MESFEKIIRETMKNNAHMHYNHIEIVSVKQDHAVFQMEIHPNNMNPYGIVHGGALYTLADNTTAAAACSRGQPYVTQDGTLHFVSNQSEGIIKAEAWVRHRGNTTCLTVVDITGENDKLLATGEFNFFRVERSFNKNT